MMLKSEIVEITGLGQVLFQESARARHVSITVKHDQSVRVAVPRRGSFRRAKSFLLEKLPWVKRHVVRLRATEHAAADGTLPRIDRGRARMILTSRLDYLAGKYGYAYNRVFIREQRTRWGSCSGKNNISLNANLVRLPGELMDYVILHELVHTRHKNHSKDFWSEVEGLVGDVKRLKKELRKFKLGL